MHVSAGALRGQESQIPPGDRVTGSCEPPKLSAGNRTPILCKHSTFLTIQSQLSSPAAHSVKPVPSWRVQFHCLCLFVFSFD